MPHYAGIGSRETPYSIRQLMTMLAEKMQRDGMILRSGHAPGADQAFEKGAGENAEIFLPWSSFENDAPTQATAVFHGPTLAAAELAAQHHPAWDRLSSGARRLHARNCHQILGWDLDQPVEFVICWTRDGVTSEPTSKTGGTGQAIRIANSYDIPVYNLGRTAHYRMATDWLCR